jgi:enoyl-CoA hydratase/carnithine racemase
MDAALTARYFSATEAFDHHLIDRLVPAGQHLAAADDLAETVLGHPPLAIRAQVRARRWDLYRLAVETEAAEDPGLHLTADYQEAISSFVEQRKPNYQAR